MTFENLGLAKPILQALAAKGYNAPTPIQAQAIPVVLEGRDLLGIAQTGTGKTAAFMLPSIDRLRASGQPLASRSCRMLVLAPTRELAGQIAANARDYGALSGLTVASVVGGTSVGKDRQKLARGVDILVATPGRLVDLIEQRAMTLGAVEILVLDEADQMLDLGFIHALRKIVPMLPTSRQTLLFSATMPKAIGQLAAQYLRDPAKVSVTPAATTAERVDQFICFVSQPEKQALLTLSLRKGFESGEMNRVLVFTRTKHGADRVVRKLGQSGLRAHAIHGNRSQPQRERALGEFREGKVRVLVATDIAARGIDVPQVSHVFNFELPNVPEQYVHRIGRTARAGATGVAIGFCAPDERAYLRDIERLTKVTLQQVPLPAAFRDEVERLKTLPSEPERAPRPDSRPDSRRRGPRNTGQRNAGPRVTVTPRGESARSEARGDARKDGGRGEGRNASGRRNNARRDGPRRGAAGGQRAERRPN